MTTTNSFNYPNVLRLLADEIEQVNRLQAKVDQDARLVQWVRDFEKSNGEFSIRTVAQIFNLPPRFLFQYLRDQEILMEGNTANPELIEMGWLVEHQYSFKQKNGQTKSFNVTRITPAGMVEIWTMLWDAGNVPIIDNI